MINYVLKNLNARSFELSQISDNNILDKRDMQEINKIFYFYETLETINLLGSSCTTEREKLNVMQDNELDLKL